MYEGLPTAEKYRGMNPYVAAVQLIHEAGVDNVFVGDNQASVFQKTSVPKKFRGTWYGYDYNNRLKGFKITSTKIVLAGYTEAGVKTRTYKYTEPAHVSYADYNSHQLIKSKGNRMLMSYPNGETAVAYVTGNHKKLYVGINMWVDTYYKSKSAAKKNHQADKSRSIMLKLSKLVWGY